MSSPRRTPNEVLNNLRTLGDRAIPSNMLNSSLPMDPSVSIAPSMGTSFEEYAQDPSTNISSASTSNAPLSESASEIFSMISPHLPPALAPKVMRTISDAFANAQSRISTAEAQRDASQVRLRQAESMRKNDERVMAERSEQHAASLAESRRQRDEAMGEVNSLHHALQKMKVKESVTEASMGMYKDRNDSTNNGNSTSSNGAVSAALRSSLQKEFDEKKSLLEQRWDHALHLVTDQMKKQRDEQVALAISKFDVEQRLKFQAEISKGLEKVEAAARAEVTDLTKLCLKMHATIENQHEKIAKLTDELGAQRQVSETKDKISSLSVTQAAEVTAASEFEQQQLQRKLTQSNVLIEELQRQVEEWKAKSDGDWFRDRMSSYSGAPRYAALPNNKAPSPNRTVRDQEDELRRSRHESIRIANEMSGGMTEAEMNHQRTQDSLKMANDISSMTYITKNANNRTESMDNTHRILGIADDVSLVSSAVSDDGQQHMSRRDLSGVSSSPYAYGDAAGGAGARVEFSSTQPSNLQSYIGHPRLDALLQSF